MAASHASPGHKGFIARELNGTSFLALEHVGHMVLSVIIPALVLSGIMAALTMWFGIGSVDAVVGSYGAVFAVRPLDAVMGLGLVASLLTLLPLLVLLDRRTRAEWHKRPKFAGRLAYKVPVYAALAAVTTAVIACKIQILYVLVASLAYIGVTAAPYTYLYADVFLPAFLGLVIYGVAWWYLFALAKGRDHGQIFSVGMATFGIIIAGAIFVSSVVMLRSPQQSPAVEPYPSTMYKPSNDALEKYSR